MKRGFWRAYLRLLAVQGSWNYERMTGIGLGFAAQPLLEDLKEADPARHAEALVRAVEYFNSHPYLAGLALGAQVRAEDDRAPEAQIARLRTALTSPLGALGDQLFWAGVVPAVMGLSIVAVALGAPAWVPGVFVAGYAVLRLATGYWALHSGLASGPQVGMVVGRSWLPRWAARIGPLAGGLVGLALPLAAGSALAEVGSAGAVIAVLTTGVALTLSWRFGPKANCVRVGLGALGLTLLLVWGLR